MYNKLYKQLKRSEGDSDLTCLTYEILEMADGNSGGHLFKEQNSHTQYNYTPEFHT